MGADECLINSAKSFALIFNYHERWNMVSKQGINYIDHEKLGLITCCKGFKDLEMADKMRFELMVPKYVIFQVWCIKPLCHMSYV